MAIALSHNGKELAFSINDSLYVYELNSFQEIFKVSGHDSPILKLSFLPTGEIISLGLDSVRIWDTSRKQIIKKDADTPLFLHACAFTPDGSAVVGFVSGGIQPISVVTNSNKFEWLINEPHQEQSFHGSSESIQFACSTYKGYILTPIIKQEKEVKFQQEYKLLQNHKLSYPEAWYEVNSNNDNLGLLLDDRIGTLEELRAYREKPTEKKRSHIIANDGRQLIVIDQNNENEIAWHPGNWFRGATHPSDLIWAGTSGKYLTMVKLETFGDTEQKNSLKNEWYWADQNQNTDYKTIFQPGGLPTLAEMQELPRWAKVAFAARCGRYVQKVFSEVWCEVPNVRTKILDNALFAVERGQFQNVVTLLSEVNNVVNSTNELRPSRNSDANQAYNASASTLYAVYALKCAAQYADSSLSENAVDSAIASVEANPSLLTVLRSDFNRLRVISQLCEWGDEEQTPLSIFLENGSI